MNKTKVYLSSEQEMFGNLLTRQINDKCDFYDILKPYFFNPLDYEFDETKCKNEREIMSHDLYKLRESDIVIVYFNDTKSVKMSMEMAIAKEHHKPIIGLNENNVMLHPWLEKCCTRICNDMNELVEYIMDFYLK